MADCIERKIDSNVTGLAIAEEKCLMELPTLAEDGADPVWHEMEPNSYSDLGGESTTVAREPISADRQNKKGTVVDFDASGAFNQDFTQSNLTRLLQGFFFADAREKPATQSLNAPAVAITGVTAANKTYAAASGLAAFGIAGFLLAATGFASAANNGLKTVASAAAGAVVVNETVVNEAAPPAAAGLRVVGFQFPAGDASFALVGGTPSLVSAATDMTELGLTPGEWVYIGGDNITNRFDFNGFARVDTIAENAITFDDVAFVPANAAGTGKSLQLFFGTVLRNEGRELIKRRSYTVERTLGNGEFTGIQAEYLSGAVMNELTLNAPLSDKLNADLSFVACEQEFVTGEAGVSELKPGTRAAAPGEDAFNTSSDLVRIKMHIHDPNTANPAALFGYVNEATLSIANGVTPNKALGTVGAFDTSAGNFVVSGSVTAYFTTVSAVKAVRNNADVGLSFIFAAKRAGFVFDVPLLGLGGGRLAVEKDTPIMLPLEIAAGKNKHGYTAMHVRFEYLPLIAMP